MSIPPIPPPLEHLAANRAFSFYPAILNIEHNEWIFRKSTWSEILVVNVKSQQELWIPRRFLGEISRIEDPVVIQGLIKELEFKSGVVLPHQRRVIEMPIAVGARPLSPPMDRPAPAPVVGIRLESDAETRVGRLIMGALIFGVLACVIVVMVTRDGPLRPRVVYTNTDQAYLDLSNRDDSFAITSKLGKPAEDKSYTKSGDLHFRSLWYPQRSYYVILMGAEAGNLRYIGAMDKDWHMIHSVPMLGGANTASMLRGLQKF